MFSTDYPGNSREERIECGRRIIEQMKKQNLREKRETRDFMLRQDPEVQKTLTTILSRVMQQGLVVNEENVAAIQEIVEEEQATFRKNKIQEFFETKGASIPQEQRETLEEAIAKKSEEGISLDEMEEAYAEMLNAVQSQSNKIEEFVTKMLRTRSNVVYEVTSRMKEYFISDLLKNSQNQDTPQFSNAAWDLFFRAKKLNYKEYVQYTNWNYQTKELPQAAMKLVEECAEGLVKTGAIRNKFYDETVRDYVEDEEALSYMKTQYKPEEQYISYRKEHGIGDLKAFARPSKDKYKGTNQYTLMKLLDDIYSYVQNGEKVFAIKYENTFHAVKTRIRKKIETALSENPKVSDKHLYKDILQTQIDEIRQEIIHRYGTTKLSVEQTTEFTNEKIKQGLMSMEKKMALQMSIDYIAGMADKTFIELAIKTGYLSPEVVKNGVRGAVLSEQVQQLMNRMDNEQVQNVSSDPGEGR